MYYYDSKYLQHVAMIYEDNVLFVYLVEVELNMYSWCNCQLYVKFWKKHYYII